MDKSKVHSCANGRRTIKHCSEHMHETGRPLLEHWKQCVTSGFIATVLGIHGIKFCSFTQRLQRANAIGRSRVTWPVIKLNLDLYSAFLRRRVASSHIINCKISLSSPKLLTFFRNSRWRPPPSWIFSSCKFGQSGVLLVWYLCSVPNLVQISVIVTEIDAHMLQTFI